MGLSLLAAFDWHLPIVILEVAFGLGMVIFVHELGHFLVAKWCDVKCEKFYLGFDIYGLKLFHFRRGETEYGIGILPLGGYVKMLGQDDNPSRTARSASARRSAPTKGSQTRPAASRTRPAKPPRSIRAVTWPKVSRNAWPSSRPA